MNYFSERLKSARKAKGFSLQDLSDALDNRWNKQYVNRLELGEAKPDNEVLLTLCEALNVTLDYFQKDAQLELNSIEFRKLKKLPGKEQEKVINQTKEVLERYIELENHLGIDQNPKFEIRKCTIETMDNVENAAKEFRDKIGIGTDAIYKVVELLEDINIKVIQETFDSSFSGMSTDINNGIMVIVLNSHKDIPIVRKRLTALHELAHLYLDLSNFDEKTEEKICDKFASAVLLPADKLKSFFGEKRTQILLKELQLLASDYGISMKAILYRCMDLGIISASYYKYYMINYNKWDTKQKEFNVFKVQEKSDRFLQLLMRGVAEEVITMSKAAALNNQKLGDFRDLIDNID
jgi:Zn-dependent peptidase ImmA (M78 family)